MALADLTVDAVNTALHEFDSLGRNTFLAQYGFKEARHYFLLHDGKRYDSKPIAGAAHGFLPGEKPLRAADFSGGERTVKAKLESLGFRVVREEGEPAFRNPPWVRDELILALDLYFRHRPDRISKTHAEVIALSEVLNELPLQTDRPDATRFRNPNGVYMKLCNFLRFDPEYKGKGLEAGGKAEETVWSEFGGDRTRLHALAKAIKAGRNTPEVKTAAGTDEEGADEFPEGRVLFRIHRARERSAALREKAKAVAMKKIGRLACAVCGFNFADRYGKLGEGYIECHHTLPLSELVEERKTRVEDVALLCANCHRMVHRKRPWLGVGALKSLLPERA